MQYWKFLEAVLKSPGFLSDWFARSVMWISGGLLTLSMYPRCWLHHKMSICLSHQTNSKSWNTCLAYWVCNHHFLHLPLKYLLLSLFLFFQNKKNWVGQVPLFSFCNADSSCPSGSGKEKQSVLNLNSWQCLMRLPLPFIYPFKSQRHFKAWRRMGAYLWGSSYLP